MEYRYTGIILSKKDVAEADRLYVIYTIEAGKIRALAKSVRKSKSKLAGFLENFSLVNIIIARTQGTGKIASVITENNFSNLRNNLEALRAVFEASGIFNKLVSWENADKELFHLFSEYLESVDLAATEKTEENFDIFNFGFIFKALNILGYKIEANVCVVCGKKIIKGNNNFSAEHGGVVCADCGTSLAGNKIIISDNSIKLIRIFFNNSIKSLRKIKIGEEDKKNLRKIVLNFLGWINL
jgi:DNA repair protein RecO (recombination protein O)